VKPLNTKPHDFEPQLLLYAAGELSAEESTALQAALAADAALRDRLAEVQQLMQATDSAFEAADGAASAPQVQRASLRATGAIRQWQAKRLPSRVIARPAVAGWQRARVGQWAAVAAIVLMAAGIVAIRNWPTKGDVAKNSTRNLPLPDPEERAFHFNALDELARGEALFSADTNSDPVTTDSVPEVPQVMPPTTDEAIASADGPIFDVPLTPDAEPLP